MTLLGLQRVAARSSPEVVANSMHILQANYVSTTTYPGGWTPLVAPSTRPANDDPSQPQLDRKRKKKTHFRNHNIRTTLTIPNIHHLPTPTHTRHIHRPHKPLNPLNVHPILLRNRNRHRIPTLALLKKPNERPNVQPIPRRARRSRLVLRPRPRFKKFPNVIPLPLCYPTTSIEQR